MVGRLSLYTSQSPWWHSDCPFTHHSFPVGTKTIPRHTTVSLVALRLSLYSSQSTFWPRQSLYSSRSTWWLRQSLYSSQSPSWYSDYPSLVALRLLVSLYSSQSTWWLRQSLYSSQSPWWYSDYPNTHLSLPGGTQTISTLITVSFVVLILSLSTSKFL